MYQSILIFVIHFSFFTIHFSLFTIQGQDVSFYKENITMKIDEDYFYVAGNYYLKTSGNSSIILVYPFPVDSLYGEVDSINIYNLNSNRPIELMAFKRTGAVFKVEFMEEKEIQILIAYRQKLLGNRAEYILESTASWRKPLEQADYQLIAAPGIEITSFSIQPDEAVKAGDEKIYYWTKKNYMPAVNMIFGFRKY